MARPCLEWPTPMCQSANSTIYEVVVEGGGGGPILRFTCAHNDNCMCLSSARLFIKNWSTAFKQMCVAFKHLPMRHLLDIWKWY